jgi:FIST N domain
MTTKAGVGTSRHHNPNIAGREAAEQALREAGITTKPDFVFMFASVGYDQHSLLRAVRQTTQESPLSGCSVEGTINGDSTDESNYSVVSTTGSGPFFSCIIRLAASTMLAESPMVTTSETIRSLTLGILLTPFSRSRLASLASLVSYPHPLDANTSPGARRKWLESRELRRISLPRRWVNNPHGPGPLGVGRLPDKEVRQVLIARRGPPPVVA